MNDRKTCTVEWCTALHNDDPVNVARHRALVAEEIEAGTRVTVTLVWAERRDGQPSTDAHVAVTGGRRRVDLTARQAASLAGLLHLTEGRPWMAGALAQAAATLTPDTAGEDDKDVPEQPAAARSESTRFTWGFVVDVFDALERNGFRKGDDVHTGKAIGLLYGLVETYEGIEGRR